jgi:virulence factor Mce-like protein
VRESLITRVVKLPGRVVRGAWQFINPSLKAGRIPFTRTMVVMQVFAALVFIYYTLIKKDVHLPLSKAPYYVEVVLPDAKGLNPQKEPAVGVAGVPVGKVVAARIVHGQAVIRMRLDHDLRGKIFADATAFVRPTSVLQTLIVNITPGDQGTGPLPDGTPIPASRTGAFVSIDQLTGILDPDTQAQVQVLLHEAAKALTGREPEIREIFTRLGRLTDGVTPLARALADRRKLLAALTKHLDKVMTTFGERSQQLAATVALGNRTLAVTARRAPELAAATRDLAPTLAQAHSALTATRSLADTLVPALDSLSSVAPKLTPTANKLTELAPVFGDFVDRAKRLNKVGRTPVHLLAGGLIGQDERVRNDQIPALRELAHLSKLLYQYRFGIVETAVNLSGVFSTARNVGVAAQAAFVTSESSPAAFGLTAAQARQKVGDTTRLGQMFAKMLEYTCRDSNAAACLMRFTIPGLPAEPLLPPVKRSGEAH